MSKEAQHKMVKKPLPKKRLGVFLLVFRDKQTILFGAFVLSKINITHPKPSGSIPL
jgi:hypothetical protein